MLPLAAHTEARRPGPGDPVNKVMFCGSGEHFTRAELDGFVDAAVRVFLAAYT